MPVLRSIGLGRPEGYYPQRRVFDALGHREIWWPIFEGAGMNGRPLNSPPEEAFSKSPQEQQDSYAASVLSLSRKAILGALESSGVSPQDIGYFVFHSCTGVPLCPSFPSVLAGEMGLPPSGLFLPLHGIGCQGSGPALRVADDWLRLNALGTALVVSCEISHAAYHPRTVDDGHPNTGVFIGNSIFGDGAACAVLSGYGKGLHLQAFLHRTDFSHRDKIGMSWVEGRYRLVLATDVPEIMALQAREAVLELLKNVGLDRKDIRHFIVHSGGSAIIRKVQESLELSDDQVRIAWENWREVGNLSSATVLFALERLMRSGDLREGDRVVAVTLGAGTEADVILGTWY